jgi:iron complex outermembrane receptor protein
LNKHFILKKSVVAVAMTLATSQFAMAQQTAAQPVTQVFVTGSNLKRSDKEGTSPVEVISAKQIAQTGANTVSELLHSIPAFGSGTSVDTTDGGFSRGASTASLRGLGSSSTLILLNGRRITASAYADPNQGKSAVYDLNNIPVSAIERVEIFKDGASAVYGSDAIAGVINFITKTNYNGRMVSVNASANDDGEFGRRSINGLVGFGDLGKDRYNVFISADYAVRDSTKIADVKDVDNAKYAYINGRMNPFSSQLTDQPFYYREQTAGARNFANSYALRDQVINRTDCDPSKQLTGSVTEHNLSATSTLVGRTFCNVNLNDYSEAQSAGKDANLLSRVTFAITPDLTSFTEIGYSRSERTYLGAPRAIQSTSPSTVFQLGSASEYQLILPVGHPDNPFPTARSAVGMRFTTTRAGSDNLNESGRFLTGLKGTVGSFDWEAAALYNRMERVEHGYGQLYKPTIDRIMTENRTIAATLADPSATVVSENRNFAQVTQFDAKASTTIGTLKGGDIGLAFGAEVREERIGLTPDSRTATGQIIGVANSSLQGKRRVGSAFIETRTPFTKAFEMDFAGRYDKYPDYNSFVPKVGAKWDVASMATLRATAARGFRAPALLQVSPGGVQSFTTVVDTVRCPDGVTPLPGAERVDCRKGIYSMSEGNPDLVPEKSKSYSMGLILTPTKNVDVLIDYYKIRKESETALQNAQFVIDHSADFPGRVVRDTNPATQLVDANGNMIPNSGPMTAVNRKYVNQGSTEVSGIDFEVAMRQSLGVQGALSSKLSWSYMIGFKRAERPGDRAANAVGTVGGISDSATSVAEIPRNRASWNTTWTKGVHALTGSVDYVSAVSLMRNSNNREVYPTSYCHYGVGQPGTAKALGGLPKFSDYAGKCEIKSWTTVGVSYTYTGFKNLSLNLNIRNLFDEEAPYDPAATVTGFNSQLHNGQGRYFKMSATYSF